MVASGGCDGVVDCLSPGLSCHTQTRAHSTMICWMTMPHHPSARCPPGWQREVPWEAGSESLRSGVIVHVISKQMCTQSYVCDASVLGALGLSEVHRRLLWPGRGLWFQSALRQASDVMVSGCPRSGSSRSVSSVSSPSFVRLILVSAASMSPLSMSSLHRAPHVLRCHRCGH